MTGTRLHDDEVAVDEDLVRRLLAEQFPEWAGLPVRRLPSTGTDHAVHRVGDDLLVRLPRIAWAEQQVERELAWLAHVAPGLPVAVPEPIGRGEPGCGYPHEWLVSRWVSGTDGLAAESEGGITDWTTVARDLAGFVRALQRVDADQGPKPGKRGRSLAPHDEYVRAGIERLADEIDAGRATEIWAEALAAEPWAAPPVWLHGDLLPGNLVFEHGRLTAVIDWGATGVGDPACDALAAWWLPPDARAVFRSELGIDDATWARAKGWTIEQTVAFIPYYEHSMPGAVAATRRRLHALLDE